ncbi:hypothetical protein NDU88_010917 [Pleurodeles waltl]|uniref:Uncharacterized protein n=1 Tax=Pleurodeles waltl TaxID=8319 RepID=A0AAV7Q043_PLEWA|nr:hypothetical protein NDU88_010917 [Pleurodeles waltl]
MVTWERGSDVSGKPDTESTAAASEVIGVARSQEFGKLNCHVYGSQIYEKQKANYKRSGNYKDPLVYFSWGFD